VTSFGWERKHQLFEREANGMGGCCEGDRTAGQHASYRVEPSLDYFFGNGPSRSKVKAGAFNHYECIAGCSQYSEVELIAQRASQAG